MDWLIGLAAVTFIFGTPFIALILNHQRKMAELRQQSLSQADSRLLAELQDVKQQIAELRDTTTRYDLSFDTALQRLEGRMTNVEQRVAAVEQGQPVRPGM